ncbi:MULTISPECIES: hypothetical protein [Bacillaceae]|uniref:Uncharacterized protein n=1 Tax=Niallia alba TaxID=2729105 RepID=A0A7Y0PMQ1_9BACI|nr:MULTISPECIES: hypothetical protein [Bacillaceae]MBZ9536567.1 hypothetical protein [Cytobacillus oceanisediminis]NMO77581.1 hypothetical protein [Niallia alba]
MKNKILNFVVLALILSAMVINNLEGLHPFKMIVNNVAMGILILIGSDHLYRHLKRSKTQ